MANQRRPNALIGRDSFARLAQAPQQFQEPTLAQQVAAAAARKGWLTPPAASANRRQPPTTQARVPRSMDAPSTASPDPWKEIVNRLTGDYSDYTTDPATAREFSRMFPTAGTPDWHYSSAPPGESWSRWISRYAGAGAGAGYTGDAAAVAAIASAFPLATPVAAPTATILGGASSLLSGAQLAADAWTAASEGDSYPLAQSVPGLLMGPVAGRGVRRLLKGEGRTLSELEKRLLSAATNSTGQLATESVPPLPNSRDKQR